MTKKLEKIRKVRKKDFDKMVENLLKTPPPKNQEEERGQSDFDKSRQKEKKREED
jgi:hypothetical protein